MTPASLPAHAPPATDRDPPPRQTPITENKKTKKELFPRSEDTTEPIGRQTRVFGQYILHCVGGRDDATTDAGVFSPRA